MKFKIFFLLFIFVNCWNLFSQTTISKLIDKKAFDELSGLPLSEKYGQVACGLSTSIPHAKNNLRPNLKT